MQPYFSYWSNIIFTPSNPLINHIYRSCVQYEGLCNVSYIDQLLKRGRNLQEDARFATIILREASSNDLAVMAEDPKASAFPLSVMQPPPNSMTSEVLGEKFK